MYVEAKVLSEFLQMFEICKNLALSKLKMKSILSSKKALNSMNYFFSGLFLTFTTLGRHDYF